MAEYAARRDPNRRPTHPGELLREVIPATGRSKAEIAALLGISRQHLYDILKERKPVSASVAVRLGKLFGRWRGRLGAHDQGAYDTWNAAREPIRPIALSDTSAQALRMLLPTEVLDLAYGRLRT